MNNNINKITEGNAFALCIRQAKWRTIGGVITPLQTSELLDIHLYVGQGSSKASATEYIVTADGDTISAVMPSTLKRGVYRTWLTAIYNGREVASNCDAAFEIVAFDEHYQAYAPERVDAPMAVYLQPADVTDAELEQLKAEFRAKNAALDAAKAEAEQARKEYIAKAEAIESVATSEQVVALGALTSEEIRRVKELIGTPAEGQAETLFEAVKASPIGIIGEVEQGKKSISDALVRRNIESNPSDSFDKMAEDILKIKQGEFISGDSVWMTGYEPNNAAEALMNSYHVISLKTNIRVITDNNVLANYTSLISFDGRNIEQVTGNNFMQNCTSLISFDGRNIEQVTGSAFLKNCNNLEKINLDKLKVVGPEFLYQTSRYKKISINLPELEEISGFSFLRETSILEIHMPKLHTIREIRMFNMCRIFEVGPLVNCPRNTFYPDSSYGTLYVIIGQGTQVNLNLRLWGNNNNTVGTVTDEEFDLNFRNNIATRLFDFASVGDDTRVLTLGQYAFQKLSEETISIATNKGWIVAQA